jgi:organic hydroperoxide reductase OsmC/OhrA
MSIENVLYRAEATSTGGRDGRAAASDGKFDLALPADAEALVHAAHTVCPYSNATRGNVDVTLTVV